MKKNSGTKKNYSKVKVVTFYYVFYFSKLLEIDSNG